jgi:dipeptidyl aminopeptidase/acylaminoacyl peptidase
MRNNYSGPKKLAKLPALREKYRNNIKALREQGFEVVVVNYHGKNPMTWSYTHNGEGSALGWDHESQVIGHLLNKLSIKQ